MKVHVTGNEPLQPLRSLRAPAGLAPAVLRTLGIGCAYAPYQTLLGNVFVAWSTRGIMVIDREDSAGEFEARFVRRTGHRPRRADALPHEVERELAAALNDRNRGRNVDLSGVGNFERAVLLKTLEIPRGEVRTYAWVAKEIGTPRAVRAVGGALAANPVPIVIPCHRVVRSDGRIGEYGCGGPDAKRRILAAEGAEPERLEALGRKGIRFVGSDTTHSFCLPSCRSARRISDHHRVTFRSEAEARLAGYRPCSLCRPAGAAA